MIKSKVYGWTDFKTKRCFEKMWLKERPFSLLLQNLESWWKLAIAQLKETEEGKRNVFPLHESHMQPWSLIPHSGTQSRHMTLLSNREVQLKPPFHNDPAPESLPKDSYTHHKRSSISIQYTFFYLFFYEYIFFNTYTHTSFPIIISIWSYSDYVAII